MKNPGRALSTLLVALVVALSPGKAIAQNWTPLLKHTAAELFDEEDMRLFRDAARRTLDETPAGGTVSWANPKTESRGDLTVVSEFTWQGHRCRKLKVDNEAKGRKGQSTPSLCRVDGRWRAMSASQLQQSSATATTERP